MALLSVRSLIKRFDGLTALNSFSLDVDEGEIVGIIGPNGSGKTTFFNVLSGMYQADGGEVFFNNHPENLLKLKNPPDHRPGHCPDVSKPAAVQ